MATIKEDYCSFELSKLLKEKGFDASKIDAYFPFVYYSNGKMDFYDDDKPLFVCEAVTQAMAMKWLRVVHNFYIEPMVIKNYDKKKLEYTYTIQDLSFPGSDDGIDSCKNWDTPEEAIEEAIKYCLENLI